MECLNKTQLFNIFVIQAYLSDVEASIKGRYVARKPNLPLRHGNSSMHCSVCAQNLTCARPVAFTRETRNLQTQLKHVRRMHICEQRIMLCDGGSVKTHAFECMRHEMVFCMKKMGT